MRPIDFAGCPQLLTKRQAAYILQVSVTTLDLLRKAKGLRCVKIGGLVRFDTADIQEFVNRRKSRRPLFDVSHLTQHE